MATSSVSSSSPSPSSVPTATTSVLSFVASTLLPPPLPPPITPERPQRYEELAERIVEVARGSNGVAFGGYVRDQVVRRRGGWRDLNVWFSRRTFADDFLKSLAQKDVFKVACEHVYGPLREFSCTHASDGSPFDHMSLTVLHKLTLTELRVSVAVASYFPCNDFDVNRLTWDGHVLAGYRTEDIKYTTQEVALLRTRILSDQARMLDIFPDYSRRMPKGYAAARVRALIDRGFRVDAPAEFMPLAPVASHTVSSTAPPTAPTPIPEERKTL